MSDYNALLIQMSERQRLYTALREIAKNIRETFNKYVFSQLKLDSLDSAAISKKIRQLTTTADQINRLLLGISFVVSKDTDREVLFDDIF